MTPDDLAVDKVVANAGKLGCWRITPKAASDGRIGSFKAVLTRAGRHQSEAATRRTTSATATETNEIAEDE